MLEQPPSFIRPLWYALADITGWFNWDALSAIGTVGALWFAIVQFTAAARVQRARQVGTLTRLTSALHGIRMMIEVISLTDDNRLPRSDAQTLVGNRDLFREALAAIDAVTPQEAADARIAEEVIQLRRGIARLQEIIPADPATRIPTELFRHLAGHVVRYTDAIEELHDVVKYGPLLLSIRKVRKSIAASAASKLNRKFAAPAS